MSSSSSVCWGRRYVFSAAVTGVSGPGVTPTAVATVALTSAASVSGARSTQTTPSSKFADRSCAMVSARRVLPTPPGPVSVNNATAASIRNERLTARSASRPMSLVRGMGTEARSDEADAAKGNVPTRQEADAARSVPDGASPSKFQQLSSTKVHSAEPIPPGAGQQRSKVRTRSAGPSTPGPG